MGFFLAVSFDRLLAGRGPMRGSARFEDGGHLDQGMEIPEPLSPKRTLGTRSEEATVVSEHLEMQAFLLRGKVCVCVGKSICEAFGTAQGASEFQCLKNPGSARPLTGQNLGTQHYSSPV